MIIPLVKILMPEEPRQITGQVTDSVSPSAQTGGAASHLRSSFLIAAMMFISRVLGLLRDMATAAIIGGSASPAADAFFLAFRFPNLGRRLIEEGALGLSWIPAISAAWQSDRRRAWRLLSAFLARGVKYALIVVLLGILLTSALLAALRLRDPERFAFAIHTLETLRLILPYFFFALLTAQCAATLQAADRFGVAAAVPIIFNVFWIAALWLIAPGRYSIGPFFGLIPDRLSPYDRTAVLSCAIVLAAATQYFVQHLYLGRLRRDDLPILPADSGEKQRIGEVVTSVFRRMFPTALGLLFIQINTLLATLVIAWSVHLPHLARSIDNAGAIAAIYFAERLYEFPLGLVGVAVGTAFYPLLVQRAGQKRYDTLASDLRTALRTVLALSIPAAAGLCLLSTPLTELLFKRGGFTEGDASVTALLVRLFALGVPLFCIQPILIRTFYALGDHRRPIRAGWLSTGFFLALAVFFVAIGRPASSYMIAAVLAAAAIQTYLLGRWLRTCGTLPKDLFRALGASLLKVLAAAVVMSAALLAVCYGFDALGASVPLGRQARVAVMIAAVIVVTIPIYFGALYVVGEREIFRVFAEKRRKKQKSHPGD